MATRQLPAKPHGDTAVEPPRGKGPVKGERAPAAKAAKGRKAKAAVDAAAKRAAKSAHEGRRGAPPDAGDQQGASRRSRGPERYVRLTVRVDDGDLSVVDSHVVEGPLAQSATFEGSYAYEVTHGDRLLHAGSIPDLGVVRSFAHPNGTLEQQRHHTYELTTYEFHARVPADALKRSALPKTAVVLYRVKEKAAARAPVREALSAAPLGEQRSRELREVGRVVGLPPSVLGTGGRRTAQPAARPRSAKQRGTKRATKRT